VRRFLVAKIFLLMSVLWLGVMTATVMASAQREGLSGQLGINYAEFSADDDLRGDDEGSHFFQHYALMYDRNWGFARGRAGHFSLGLGGEWASLASDINNVTNDRQEFKPQYNADLVFKPGGTPFFLHVYAKDHLGITPMVGRNLSLLDGQGQSGDGLGNIYADFRDGINRNMGFSLMLGQSNGRSGRYSDIWGSAPLLMVDYMDVYVDDSEQASSPIKYRDRNLAFVSLNKRDNWLHVKYFDHYDYLNSAENFSTQEFILGTIDHRENRSWINLTNWIKLSTDGRIFTREAHDGLTRAQGSYEQYTYNLFARTHRSKWEGASFSNFERRISESKVTRNLELPFYFDSVSNENRRWAFTLLGNAYEKTDLLTSTDTLNRSAYNEWRYTFGNRTPNSHTLGYDFEALDDDDYFRSESFRLSYEFDHLRRRQVLGQLQSSLELYAAHQGGEVTMTGEELDYWEEGLSLDLRKQFDPSWSAGVNQHLSVGSGEYYSSATRKIAFSANDAQSFSDSRSENSAVVTAADYFRSITALYGENTRGRLRNRLELKIDYRDRDGYDNLQTGLTHQLDYSSSRYLVHSSTSVVWGDQVTYSVADGLTDEFARSSDMSFTHQTNVVSYLGKGSTLILNGRYEYADTTDGPDSRFDFRETYRYTRFTVNGVVRKFYELEQSLEYERRDPVTGEGEDAYILVLGGSYYPTHRLFMGANTTYTYKGDTYSTVLRARAGIHFPKLQFSLNYGYGQNDDGRTEQRWGADLSKTF